MTLKESNEHVEAKLKNAFWLQARQHDSQQVIPSQAPFDQPISLVNQPVTTPGMLTILKAWEDDNHTITTVINCFMDITANHGQPCTVLAIDQSLYSRGKELISANMGKYKDVVLVMGNLHILFKFSQGYWTTHGKFWTCTLLDATTRQIEAGKWLAY